MNARGVALVGNRCTLRCKKRTQVSRINSKEPVMGYMSRFLCALDIRPQKLERDMKPGGRHLFAFSHKEGDCFSNPLSARKRVKAEKKWTGDTTWEMPPGEKRGKGAKGKSARSLKMSTFGPSGTRNNQFKE